MPECIEEGCSEEQFQDEIIIDSLRNKAAELDPNYKQLCRTHREALMKDQVIPAVSSDLGIT